MVRVDKVREYDSETFLINRDKRKYLKKGDFRKKDTLWEAYS